MADSSTTVVAPTTAEGWRYQGNPYRDGRWMTSELIREREHLRWLLADLDLHPGPVQRTTDNSIAYHLLDLQDIEDELARRERLKASKYAPKVVAGAVPDRSQLVREIKERLSVETLLRRKGVDLKPAGRAQKCRCPLPGHEDRTPSFYVYPDGGWHCFGCGRSGDLIELTRWLLNERSFVIVVEALAKEAGVEGIGNRR